MSTEKTDTPRVRAKIVITWTGEEYSLHIADTENNPPDLLFSGLSLVRIRYSLVSQVIRHTELVDIAIEMVRQGHNLLYLVHKHEQPDEDTVWN